MNFDRRMRSKGKPVPEEHRTFGPPMFPVNRTCPGMSGVVVADDRVGGVVIVSAGSHVKRAARPLLPCAQQHLDRAEEDAITLPLAVSVWRDTHQKWTGSVPDPSFA